MVRFSIKADNYIGTDKSYINHTAFEVSDPDYATAKAKVVALYPLIFPKGERVEFTVFLSIDLSCERIWYIEGIENLP